mgnify:CR=1 FL=1
MKYNTNNAPIWIEDQHELSVNLARAYAISYAKDHSSEQTEHLFELYKESRRAIPHATNGSRYGSYDAYMARDTYIGA